MDPTALIDAVTKGGPLALFVVMTFMWWLERGERIKSQERERECQERERDLSLQYLKSTVKQTNSLRSLRSVMLQGRAPHPDEYEAEDVE